MAAQQTGRSDAPRPTVIASQGISQGGYMSSSSNLTYVRAQALTAMGNSSVVVKLICAALLFGYLVSFLPHAVDLLTVLPGNLIPPNFWIWTCFTHSFIEVHCWMVVCDVAVVFLYGKLLEPLWGALEMLRFFVLLNVLIGLLTALTYLMLYLVTRDTDLLFTQHIHGLAGYLAGFSVAVKQSMADHVLVNSPFGKLRNKHVPLWVLLIAVLVRLIGGVDAPFPIMFAWGLIVSWIYLRFYQRHSNGNKGDMADSFSFASFFPDVLQPVVAVLSNTVYSLLVRLRVCSKTASPRRFEAPVSVAVCLPGSDTHDAERRRQLALKALNERLNRTPATNWPDLDEADVEDGGAAGSKTMTTLASTAAQQEKASEQHAVAVVQQSTLTPASADAVHAVGSASGPF